MHFTLPHRWSLQQLGGCRVEQALHLFTSAATEPGSCQAAQQPAQEQDVPQPGSWPWPASPGGGKGRRRRRKWGSSSEPPPPNLLVTQPSLQPVVLLAVVLFHTTSLPQPRRPGGGVGGKRTEEKSPCCFLILHCSYPWRPQQAGETFRQYSFFLNVPSKPPVHSWYGILAGKAHQSQN